MKFPTTFLGDSMTAEESSVVCRSSVRFPLLSNETISVPLVRATALVLFPHEAVAVVGDGIIYLITDKLELVAGGSGSVES